LKYLLFISITFFSCAEILDKKISPNHTIGKIGSDAKVLINSLNHPTVIHFWSSWCKSCAHEFPAFNNFSRYAKSQGINVISIIIDDTEAGIRNVLAAQNLHHEIYLDNEGTIKETLNILTIPETIFYSFSNGKFIEQDRVEGLQNWGSAEVLGYLEKIREQPPMQIPN